MSLYVVELSDVQKKVLVDRVQTFRRVMGDSLNEHEAALVVMVDGLLPLTDDKLAELAAPLTAPLHERIDRLANPRRRGRPSKTNNAGNRVAVT